MANDLNQCNFIGRLGRDPEQRVFPSGDMVANATLAVGSKWKAKDSGEIKEATEWVRLVFNGKTAEIACQYLRKGSQIFVTGEMRTREWEKDGVKHYSTEIRVSNFQMLGPRQDGQQGAQDHNQGQPPAPRQQAAPRPDPAAQQASRPAPSSAGSGFESMDDDVPFRDPMSYRGAHLAV